MKFPTRGVLAGWGGRWGGAASDHPASSRDRRPLRSAPERALLLLRPKAGHVSFKLPNGGRFPLGPESREGLPSGPQGSVGLQLTFGMGAGSPSDPQHGMHPSSDSQGGAVNPHKPLPSLGGGGLTSCESANSDHPGHTAPSLSGAIRKESDHRVLDTYTHPGS